MMSSANRCQSLPIDPNNGRSASCDALRLFSKTKTLAPLARSSLLAGQLRVPDYPIESIFNRIYCLSCLTAYSFQTCTEIQILRSVSIVFIVCSRRETEVPSDPRDSGVEAQPCVPKPLISSQSLIHQS